MIGKTVLHEVLDINRRTIYPNAQLRQASAVPLSFEWIYRNKACSHSDVAALLNADVNEHLLVDAISKLKIDISKVAAKPLPSSQAKTQLLQLDRDVDQLVRRSDLDRETILQNLKMLDNKPPRFFNNRSSASSPSVSPMTAVGEKSPADTAARKNALTRLAVDRAALQQAVDSLDSLDLEDEAVCSGLAAIHSLADSNAAMAASQVDALCKQIAVKRDNLEFVEHNMMRDRHFILDKLCAKREEIKLLEDHCHKLLEEARQAAAKLPLAREAQLPPEDSPLPADAFAFDKPAFGVRVFEEDMSKYSHKTYSHRDDVSIHDLHKDSIRAFVRDTTKHDFKKHLALQSSPNKPALLPVDRHKRVSAKGFLSPQLPKRPLAT